jgi:ubiquinone/menaquinone biosynthesis C-methylase UbiE
MELGQRRFWSQRSHEQKVEKFYGWGVEGFGDFHGGYLNFGLWEEGVGDYLGAAENMVRRMGALLGLGGESRLLDVGCGMGSQDLYLLRNFNPQSIDGLDVTWPHVEHARRRAREAGCEGRVRFHHGTATSIPFPSENFTHVLSIEAPEHFDTREDFLRETYRVLAPGGVAAFADYTLKREPRNVFERFVVEAARRLWKVPRVNVVTSDTYREKMRRAGFVNVEVEEVGRLTIPGYYREQRRPETVRELTKIRGVVAGRLGWVIDVAVLKAYEMGLMEYVFVRAEKPATSQ